MHFLGFIWNPDETIFQIGFIQIKYYNLSWILAFVLGWYLMKRIFQNENKSMAQLDSLFVYGVVSIMMGARLGHVIFYQSELFTEDPLSILLPIQTVPEFKFTGFAGLASHGAAILGVIGLYVFTRKQKDISLLWLLDRVVMTCSIGGAFVRLGNFFNSEINGKEVEESFFMATKFVRDAISPSEVLRITKEQSVNVAYKALETNPDFTSYLEAIPYRHPVQLYEAIGYLIVFLIMYYWMYRKTDLPKKEGFLFGFWLVTMWGPIRFILEYFKRSQGGFEESWGTFTTGQWLSIPFVLIGLYLMFRPQTNKG
ncbi:MAG: prolipoprotein diacylglyceryl transferase [Bacteroidota bacterium]